MRFISGLAVVCLLGFTSFVFAQSDRELLGPGHKVYVLPLADHDTDKAMKDYLRAWKFWPVVETREAADLVLEMNMTGNEGFGRATLEVTLRDAKADTPLWVSKKQTGLRSAFHGYKSPLTRACEGILKQMKEASNTWPTGHAQLP